MTAEPAAPLTLTMHEVAERLGLTYDHFRKAWPRLARYEGFPRPFLRRIWQAAAVERWLEARTWCHAANDATPEETNRPRGVLKALRAG